MRIEFGAGQWGVKGMLSLLLTQMIEFIPHMHYSLKREKKKNPSNILLTLMNLSKDSSEGKCNGFWDDNFLVMFPFRRASEGVEASGKTCCCGFTGEPN